MRFRYDKVDRTPSVLAEGVVYHNEDFELASLLCACGCGHRVTLLVPDGHQVLNRDGFATIHPSIGVMDAPCKSHYVITAGKVHWLPAFSSAQAAAVMRRQVARHVWRDTPRTPVSTLPPRETKQASWLRRWWKSVEQFFSTLFG